MENGISVNDLIERADNDAKKSYMTRVWSMTCLLYTSDAADE